MKTERIDELQEKMHEFILNHADIGQRSVSWGELAELQSIAESDWNETDDGKELIALLDGKESVEVVFRKFPEGDVIAFIYGYPCNPGMVMSYMHIGQHSEASVGMVDVLEHCTNDEIKALLDELTSIGYDVTLREEN
jgi:hypothetical protein